VVAASACARLCRCQIDMSMREVKNAIAEVKPTLSDRIVGYFSPEKALRRRKARVAMALAGSYKGASRSRKATQTWSTSNGDADGDLLFDLPTLRERSRDLVRNNPLAAGAFNTKVGNIVGTGLKLQSHIDAEYLGLNDDEAAAWQRHAEREFRMWAESPECDVARTLNFYGQQELALRGAFENGDIFAFMPYIERQNNIYSLTVQLIESDRISNPNHVRDTKQIAGGVEHDKYGAPIAYHIMRNHPGAITRLSGAGYKWDRIPAFGLRSARRNVLHLYRKLRPGQTRGAPDMAPVIEAFKQLGDYTEAELTAAVVSGMFTVFTHIEGDYGLQEIGEFNDKYGESTTGELKMGNGSIIDLGPNEKVDFANPGRPNQVFDPFVLAILRQIGTALELPVELLIQQFNSSYSASKAAIEQAWVFFRMRRKWLADNFCRPIYQAWMYEAVALGRLKAPGFARDPAIRNAYFGSEWIGPSKPVLDLVKEVTGREKMEDRGWVTAAQNTAEMTGGDWGTNQKQRAKEIKIQKENGTMPAAGTPSMPPDPGQADNPNNTDNQNARVKRVF
jgi:lambda family phage portal protein